MMARLKESRWVYILLSILLCMYKVERIILLL